MKRRFIITMVVCSAFLENANGQAPVFSQYYASALYLNPALAGLEKDTYLGLNYRSQWSNLSMPFSTFQFSFIQPITRPGAKKKHLGGWGVSYYDDVAGANKEFVTQGVSLSAAYNFHLNRHGNNIIAVALQAGESQQKVNFDGLKWSSQYSSTTGFDASMTGEPGLANFQVFHPIFNAGMMWYYTNKQRNVSHYSTSFYNGFCISNLVRSHGYYLNSKEDFSVLYKVHGGVSTTWSRRLEISPNYLIQVQDKNLQVNVGMYFAYSVINPRSSSKTGSTKVLFGAWYRLQDAVILSTGVSNAVWNVGFSYDSNVYALSRTFGYGSSYELSFAYRIISNTSFRRFSSPLI
jgi:type IX secretion system PorP/SprF family membrane protein